jgi:hypothetical protein
MGASGSMYCRTSSYVIKELRPGGGFGFVWVVKALSVGSVIGYKLMIAFGGGCKYRPAVRAS